jgi:hypothetical protein
MAEDPTAGTGEGVFLWTGRPVVGFVDNCCDVEQRDVFPEQRSRD